MSLFLPGGGPVSGGGTDPTISSSLGDDLARTTDYAPTLTHDGASVATTVIDTSDGSDITGTVCTGASTTTPTITAPGVGEVYRVTHTTTSAGGLEASISRVVGQAGAGGITAPTAVLSIDYTDEASADWSADSGTSRTVDTYSLSSYAGGASTYGPDGSTGIVMETSDASTGTILGTGLVIDISGEAAQDRFVVITQQWTGIDLPAADDYVVFEALGRLSPSVRGPGGGVWLLGDGKIYAVARRSSNDAPLSALATTLGAVPSTFWTRLVIDRVTGVVRSYYSTTAPGSSSLSGGMTLAGYARQAASDSVATTAPDVWPSNWLIQARIYRGTTDGGTTLTATLATLDIEELTP